jgi:2-polyprenyl-3-methyl-5-hydroxy-6-metoxy-1,4-benzoquinol methylase
MKNCIICNQATKPIEVMEQMLGLKEVFIYNQCLSCKHTSIDSIPSNLEKYYNSENYYSFKQPKNSLKSKILNSIKKIFLSLKKTNNFLFSITIKPIFKELNVNQDTKILDFGCGAGHLVNELLQLGYKNSYGSDIYLNTNETENTPNHLTNNIENLEIKKWDVITLNHVFEHFVNPEIEIKNIVEKLNSGGFIILRFPVIDSFAFEKYNSNWVQFDAPRHINLFTRESFKLFIKKFSLLEIQNIYDDSYHFQFTGSELYIKNKSLLKSNSRLKRIFSISTYKFHFAAKKLNKENRGDQIVVILKKKI